jgi:hypothetical protein
MQFPGPLLDESLSMLEPQERLVAVVIAEPLLTRENEALLAGILQQLVTAREGHRTAFGVMFPAVDVNSNGRESVTSVG